MSLYTYQGFVNRVVDGDTFDITIDLGFMLSIRHRFRLEGVDTPEIYGRASAVEKEHGRQASEFAKEVLEGKNVMVRSHKEPGIYGRFTATIFVDFGGQQISFADLLRDHDLLKRASYD